MSLQTFVFVEVFDLHVQNVLQTLFEECYFLGFLFVPITVIFAFSNGAPCWTPLQTQECKEQVFHQIPDVKVCTGQNDKNLDYNINQITCTIKCFVILLIFWSTPSTISYEKYAFKFKPNVIF